MPRYSNTMARDRLVEKIETERLGNLHRIGERWAAHHEALGDRVTKDEKVSMSALMSVTAFA